MIDQKLSPHITVGREMVLNFVGDLPHAAALMVAGKDGVRRPFRPVRGRRLPGGVDQVKGNGVQQAVLG